jgi:molecular chaperone DnaK
METDINLPFITADQNGPKHLQTRLSRAKLEQLVDDLLQRTMAPVKKALADAGVEPNKIDEVVLVGGSTRMPKVQQFVREYFGKEPHKGVNPDEVVAIGAAVQGGVLTGEVTDVLLLDVTPLSLGIETLGGVMTTLITRNTTIPSRKSETFSTAADNQTSVEVHVLQGERPLARDNRTIGRFHLAGLPPAPRGVPQIEVAFDIDANGIVNVSAKDLATGQEQKITISGSGGLSKGDVDRLVKEATSHAGEDQVRRELIDARNQADSLAYQAGKTLAENRDRLPAGEVSRLEAAIADLAKVSQADDLAAIKKATDDLQRAVHAVSELLYKSASGSSGSTGSSGSSGSTSSNGSTGSSDSGVKDAEVVDAEYAESV